MITRILSKLCLIDVESQVFYLRMLYVSGNHCYWTGMSNWLIISNSISSLILRVEVSMSLIPRVSRNLLKNIVELQLRLGLYLDTLIKSSRDSLHLIHRWLIDSLSIIKKLSWLKSVMISRSIRSSTIKETLWLMLTKLRYST